MAGRQTLNSHGMKAVLAVITVIGLLFMPKLLTNQYHLHVVIVTLLFSIVSLGMWLIFRTGQVSFAQAGFLAIGAYTTACLTKYLGVSFWLALPVSGATAAAFAIAVGIPTLRLRGSYFFLVTFAMGEAIRLTLNYVWVPVLGGPNGISRIPGPDPFVIPGLFTLEFGTSYSGKTSYYYLVLFAFIISFLIMRRIDKTRIGRTIVGLQDAEDLSEAIGVRTLSYRVFAFAAACFFTGIAGGIYAGYLSSIGPASFTMLQSLEFFIYIIVGGAVSVWGAVIGTFFIEFLGEAVRGWGELEIVLSGFFTIMVVLFFPSGLVGLPKTIKRFIDRRRGIVDDERKERGAATT